MSWDEFDIGGVRIAQDAPPLFLPDIGTFFNQDISEGLEMVDALADAGVHVTKAEVLHDPEICLRDAPEITYATVDGGPVTEPYRALIERKTVSLDAYGRLFEHVAARGMALVVSVYDAEGAAFAKDLGVAALKIATSNVTNQPLVEFCAATGLPLLIDTGDSSLEEIDRAVSWAREAGSDRIVVEHSPYPPPAPVTRHNLRFMKTLETALGTAVGLSDHHAGDEMLIAATALGCAVVEKGVRPDALTRDQDVAHALPISSVAATLRKISMVHDALGDGVRRLERGRPKKPSRMGLAAARALAPGDPIDRQTTRGAFPAVGVPMEAWEQVRGKSMRRAVEAGAPIHWGDVDL